MNQPILTLILVAASLTVAAAEEKKIYKYTDENGVTHYTETKPNDNYEEADLPELSVVPSVTPRPTTTSAGETTNEDSAQVSEFKILSPGDQQNLWGTGLKLTARVTPLNEAQKAKYQVQFVIDGKIQKPGNASEQTFGNIYRGEHRLEARLIDRNSKKVISKTPAITFFMHQNSKK